MLLSHAASTLIGADLTQPNMRVTNCEHHHERGFRLSGLWRKIPMGVISLLSLSSSYRLQYSRFLSVSSSSFCRVLDQLRPTTLNESLTPRPTIRVLNNNLTRPHLELARLINFWNLRKLSPADICWEIDRGGLYFSSSLSSRQPLKRCHGEVLEYTDTWTGRP